MQISGLGRKSASDILYSFPAAAMSSISFLTQRHSFSPVLQRQHYASKTNDGTAVANRKRDQKSTQASPLFL